MISRRRFLRFLGLAPVVAPAVVQGCAVATVPAPAPAAFVPVTVAALAARVVTTNTASFYVLKGDPNQWVRITAIADEVTTTT